MVYFPRTSKPILSERRPDALRCVVSTTTLTEGVNLPFKAVIIGSTGWGSGEKREVIIDTPRLLNAFGRAGRACRETEGWLFMAINQEFDSDLFNQFEWDPSELDLESTLAKDSSLAALAEFEGLLAAGTDAVLSHALPATRGFCSYVWFLAEILGELRGGADLHSIFAALQDTLAWHQLSRNEQNGWLRVAEASLGEYERTPAERRFRWARSGTSLPTNVVLEEEATRIAEEVKYGGSDCEGYLDWFRLLLPTERVVRLLQLVENPRALRGFKPYRSARVAESLSVDLGRLVLDWVRGVELDAIAENCLSSIADLDYRADVLSEFTAGVLEHHLPWVTSTIVRWTNARLGGSVIPSQLAAMLRYGVSTDTALHLMGNGIRSRRLAHYVSAALGEASLAEVRDMLRQQSLAQWRTDFQASPAELSDLLSFVRDPDQQPVADLLDGKTISAFAVPMRGARLPPSGANVTVKEDDSSVEPWPLAVFVDDEMVAFVATEDHSHVFAILQLGLDIQIEVGAVVSALIEIRIATAA
jgi:hypothetical protein